MKKAGLVILVILICVVGVVWHFRYDIFQFSAESIIKKNLPPYVEVERIIFDLQNNRLEVSGLGIKNPKGFQNRYLTSIKSIICKYRMRGRTILDGIEVTDIQADGPAINIERLVSGQLNIVEMGNVMETQAGASHIEKGKKGKPSSSKNIADLIKLTDTININGGKVTFLDKAISRPPFSLTFENVNGTLVLRLSPDYTDVLAMSTTGAGVVNGDPNQMIKWVASMDPTTPGLTMSNRVEARNVNILLFRPYYERYSPVDIKSGWFSGSLVCDFDNGNIGSMNTISLSGLRFSEKEGSSVSGSWDASISDIVKYLESSPGEVVFDFKIKGTMEHPQFYPGPRVKQAIQNMVVDKVSSAIQDLSGKEGQGAEQSDTQKIVDAMKGLFKN